MRFLAANPEKIGGRNAFHEWASKTKISALPEKAPAKKKEPK
jgi:hypothetical protein